MVDEVTINSDELIVQDVEFITPLHLENLYSRSYESYGREVQITLLNILVQWSEQEKRSEREGEAFHQRK